VISQDASLAETMIGCSAVIGASTVIRAMAELAWPQPHLGGPMSGLPGASGNYRRGGTPVPVPGRGVLVDAGRPWEVRWVAVAPVIQDGPPQPPDSARVQVAPRPGPEDRQDHPQWAKANDFRFVQDPDRTTPSGCQPRSWAQQRRARQLATRCGPVTVTRIAYRSVGQADLHPTDAVSNLPVEKHSHGLRKLAAVEAARGSFTDAAAAIERATTVRIGKRQVEELAAAAAVDVDAFYTAHAPDWSADEHVLALSFDAKGVEPCLNS
jgi:hypothetical protein